ncbi:hypothetical protein HDV05_003946 [Chytridiales sp. JEL 0842]|nr:hypothetical protein HDV05_003946 [Chytridiales sp. JEL 0842]
MAASIAIKSSALMADDDELIMDDHPRSIRPKSSHDSLASTASATSSNNSANQSTATPTSTTTTQQQPIPIPSAKGPSTSAGDHSSPPSNHQAHISSTSPSASSPLHAAGSVRSTISQLSFRTSGLLETSSKFLQGLTTPAKAKTPTALPTPITPAAAPTTATTALASLLEHSKPAAPGSTSHSRNHSQTPESSSNVQSSSTSSIPTASSTNFAKDTQPAQTARRIASANFGSLPTTTETAEQESSNPETGKSTRRVLSMSALKTSAGDSHDEMQAHVSPEQEEHAPDLDEPSNSPSRSQEKFDKEGSYPEVSAAPLPFVSRRPSKPQNLGGSLRSRNGLAGFMASPLIGEDNPETPINTSEVAALLAVGSEDDVPHTASTRKNMEFHQQFPAVPKDEVLIDQWSCAWQRDILVQGMLYLSRHHVCFSANILGWSHSLVLSFEDITAIEKKSIAGLIPNSIEITNVSGVKYYFASFLQRDTAHNVLVKTWGGSNKSIRMRTFKKHREEDDNRSITSEKDSIYEYPISNEVELGDGVVVREGLDSRPTSRADMAMDYTLLSGGSGTKSLEVTTDELMSPPALDTSKSAPSSDDGSQRSATPTTKVNNINDLHGLAFTSNEAFSLDEKRSPQLGSQFDPTHLPKRLKTPPPGPFPDDPLQSPYHPPYHSSTSSLDSSPLERRLSTASLKISKGLADLAGSSSPGSPTIGDNGTASTSGLGSAGRMFYVRENQHIVHQKHPVSQSQVKMDVMAKRPSSPAPSPDKSSPIIDLTPHLSNLPQRKPADAVVTQAKAAVVRSGLAHETVAEAKTEDNASKPHQPTHHDYAVNLHHTQHNPIVHGHQHAPHIPAGHLEKPAAAKKMLKKSRSVHKASVPPVKEATTPATCPCDSQHSKMTPIFDGVVTGASISYVWELLYSYPSDNTTPPSNEPHFMRQFISKKRKCTDFKCTHWLPKSENISVDFEPPISPMPPLQELDEGGHRRFQYVMPLSNPMGPKSTRCQLHETIVNRKIADGYICIKGASVSPDVPSGTTFVANLLTCWTRAGPGTVRLRVSCEVDFAKTPWLLLPVLRSAVPDGMKSYYQDLNAFLREYLVTHPAPTQPSTVDDHEPDELEIEDDVDVNDNYPISSEVLPHIDAQQPGTELQVKQTTPSLADSSNTLSTPPAQTTHSSISSTPIATEEDVKFGSVAYWKQVSMIVNSTVNSRVGLALSTGVFVLWLLTLLGVWLLVWNSLSVSRATPKVDVVGTRGLSEEQLSSLVKQMVKEAVSHWQSQIDGGPNNGFDGKIVKAKEDL